MSGIVDNAKQTSKNKKRLKDNTNDLELVPNRDDQPRWISNIRWCAYCSVGVLLLNIIFASTLAAGAAENGGISLHLLINLLSTVALAASSCCMQVLVAPIREQVDQCHAQGKWLDIGIPGVRNLTIVGPFRVGLWLILLLTSMPFHLMYVISDDQFFHLISDNRSYNSAVSRSMFLSQHDAEAYFIPHDIIPAEFSRLLTPRNEHCFSENYPFQLDLQEMTSYLTNRSYETVHKDRCISMLTDLDTPMLGTFFMRTHQLNSSMSGNRAFRQGTGFLGENMTLVGKQPMGVWEFDFDTSYGTLPWKTNIFDWDTCYQYATAETCDDAQNLTSWLRTALPESPTLIDSYTKSLGSNITGKPEILGNCQGWGSGYHLDFEDCLVVQQDPNCQLQYSPFIFVLVAVMMIVKIIIMVLIVRNGPSSPSPLLTIGDAVASFLTLPDPNTLGICWMTKLDLKRKGYSWRDQTLLKGKLKAPCIWIRAAKLWRKLIVLILWISCIIYVFYQLGIFAHNWCPDAESDCSAIRSWTTGIDTGTTRNGAFKLWEAYYTESSVVELVLISNLPQLFLTFSYHFYNSVLTSILAEAEYSSYGTQRKGLRVSRPQDNSALRSTYWLSVPFRYSVPLLIIYPVIGWAVSQSLSLVTSSEIRKDGIDITYSLTYSPLAIIISLALFFVMGTSLLALGLCRRFKSKLPLTGACSVIISAACHPPEPLDDAMNKVQWGETLFLPDGLENEPGVGHCSFISQETLLPSGDKDYR
ncbi:unnamed protein product [Penicillium salamii]|uniref:DUF6536 domain-containing protein n=1 Tax=Penicillium salamii TaxID=1612424 RepID=A0A9W4N411_9EURO|nr:unnamed protein product [Penicillium salamii]